MQAIAPFRGWGLGLRRQHYQHFVDATVDVDFVEVISENFMIDGGRPLATLDAVRAHYPIALHGVSLSIGSAEPADEDYLRKLRRLADRIDPLWVSDHLCWTRSHAHNSHDLLPMPMTGEALTVVSDNIARAQDALGRALLIENPSSYCRFSHDEMSEWEFLSALTRRTGCYLLLDVNNIYVSAHNHRFAAEDYLAGLPLDRVRQVHLAGHTPGEILIDTHDQPVCDSVWDLLASLLARNSDVAVMIERDDAIPPIDELLGELAVARSIGAQLSGMAHA